MPLRALVAENFRNYGRLTLTLAPGLNLFVGDNAQGKTNLLEAIFWLLRATPLRPVADRDLLLWGADSCRVEGVLRGAAGEVTVAVTLGPRGKEIRLGGCPARTSDLVRLAGVVTFTPDDLWLLKGGPRDRRRYLDRELVAFAPLYGEHLARYRRALAQRNAALRRGERGMVGVWTREVAVAGAQVLAARLEYLRRLVPAARELFARWDGGELDIRYRSSVSLAGRDVASLTAALEADLARYAHREADLGQTLVGPHRDDLGLELDGRPAAVAASQGQQRAVVLALKLAQVHLWRERTGEPPALLLDDLFSELDGARRARLLAALDTGLQMFVTCTAVPVTGVPATLYRVAAGKVTRE
ncbi:MAG: DNA replication/repair protein RecF [Bacillota bacterium]